MPPPRPSIQALAARMLGTCEGFVDEINALTVEECRELDSIVLNCVICNWWFDTDDMTDLDQGMACPDCTAAERQ